MTDITVGSIIDRRPLGAYRMAIICICAVVCLIDGMDIQLVAYLAPKIAKEFSISPGALGSVFAAGTIGMALGALLFGYVADRIGRKPALVINCVLVGAFTLLTAFAASSDQLLFLRFATGVGLGGIIPSAIATVSEYSPKDVRALAINFAYAGF